MGTSNPVVSFESTKKSIAAFFSQQLDDLGLSESLLNHQTEEELRRSLIVVDQAIENNESFGKLRVKLTAELVAIVAMSQSESHFEIGIMPMLLERKQIILRRLSEFDQVKAVQTGSLQLRNARIKEELRNIVKGEVNRRLFAVVSMLISLWILVFLLIQWIGWDLLEPWTYLVGFALTIAGYAYLVIQGKEFSPFALYHQAFERRKTELFEICGVNDVD